MAKSNFGGFNPMNPENKKKNLKFEKGHDSNIPTTPPPRVRVPTIKPPRPTSNIGSIIDEQTENGMKINVLDVPSRMQETLRKLLRQKGLRKKPFQKISKEPVIVVNPQVEYVDFKPPKGKQDTLLRNLKSNHDEVVRGLKTPSTKQDTLLRPLTDSHDEKIQGLKHPSLKQNTLLNPLTPGHSSQVPGLKVPHNKQNTLLRNLQGSDKGFVENIQAPHNKQNTLLRNLHPNDKGHVENLKSPRLKQDTLLRNLKENDQGFVENLNTPHNKQNTLLRNLKPNDHGSVENLQLPKTAAAAAGINIDEDCLDEAGVVIPLDTGSFNKQNRPSIPLEFPRGNKLNKPLRENSNGKINGLEAPSQKQDPLLGTLISNAKENFKNFKTPPRKQNTLLKNLRTNFRKIKQKNPDRTINLSVPSRTRRPPQSSSFDPDILSTPNKRQNPLLKILRFDQRERTLRKGLSPPNFKQYPLFQQVVRTPQKYHKDFLQLPPKEQNKLMEILHRYGGDRFDADALLVPPIQLIKEKTKPRFHFFNNSITTTTPLPKLRQQPFRPEAVAPTESNRNSGKFRTKVVVPSKSTTSPPRTTTSSFNVQRRPKIQPNFVESDSPEEEESLKKGRALIINSFEFFVYA